MRTVVTLALVTLLAAAAFGQQALPPCSATLRIDAFIGEAQQGNFMTMNQLTGIQCTSLLAFGLDPTLNNSTNLNVNFRGDYTYAPPLFESAERFVVTVSCFQTPACALSVVASVARRLTSAPTAAPPTPAPTPAQTECPHVYWYAVARNSTLSDSLSNAVGQLPCGAGRSYQLVRAPKPAIGTLLFTPIGDFRYTTIVNLDTWDDFGFAMYCQGVLTCTGTAYVMISNTVATAPPLQSLPPSFSYAPGTPGATSAPSVKVSPMPGMTCQGTCNSQAWKVIPTQPNVWDTTAAQPRQDQKPVNSIEASWVAGGLVIRAYGVVGNVAVRFPTFEDVTYALGDLFTGVEQRQRVATTSVPFDTNCLDLQSTAGLAEDVWKWTSITNLTGQVGSRYASGSDWYQKFGGKHINCDTFQDACRYSPLLTPPRNQDPNLGGVWSIDISNCDITWTGVFTFAALRAMRRSDGTPVWSMSNSRILQASIASEAVKPNSWIDPKAGFAANINRRNMILVLAPKVRVTLDDANTKLFSVDVEYFEFTDRVTGDRSFGLNVLFYPQVLNGATSSYAPDRHVIGWKISKQSWSHPDNYQCPTCTGTDATCNNVDNSDDSFLSNDLHTDCGNPVVNMVRGPSFSIAECAKNPMHVMNRMGFGKPQFCRPSFQNLTLRGVAPGSGPSLNMTGSFSFEGSMQLQLLLDNGAQPIINIDVSMIVGFASVEGAFSGTSDTCRAGLYWPVLDPLGTSTPDAPFPLSNQDPVELCSDRFDRTFGPQGWALITYDTQEPAGVIPYTRVQPESVYVSYPGSPNIYFLRTDPMTNRPTDLPPMENAVWWHRDYPFLNFRDLSARLPNQTFPVADGVQPITAADYAFAFTPGAIGLATEMTVTSVFRIMATNASQGYSRVTYNRVLRLDPTLTALTRFGPPQLVVVTVAAAGNSGMIALIAAGVLVFGLICGLGIEVADDDNPFLGGMAKTLKLIQMPLLLPIKIITVGTRTVVGGGKKAAPEVRRATKGGIPVSRVHDEA